MRTVLHWPATLRERDAGANGRTKNRADVILLSAGPSNSSENFYPPSTVRAAARIFEGAKCFVDHADLAEEQTRPERSIRDVAGFFSDVHVIGDELHGTLNLGGAAGDEARQILETAVRYRETYPDREWCGFSISADGASHEESADALARQFPQWRSALNRRPYWEVVDTIDKGSCDLVTAAARGGRVVSLHESRRGDPKMVRCEACGHESETSSIMDDEMEQDLRQKVDDYRSLLSPESAAALADAVQALLDGEDSAKRVDERTATSRGAVEAFREAFDPFAVRRRSGNRLSAVAAFEEAYENADVIDW